MDTIAGIGNRSDTRLHRALGDPSRARLLDLLRASDAPLDVQELGERVGLHPNTVRSHLRVLADAALVSARPEERHRPGRPRVVYEAIRTAEPPAESAPAPAGYRLLAEILASHLAGSGNDSAEQAEAAGRAWGKFLVDREPPGAPSTADEDIHTVLRMLDQFGFDPSVETDDAGDTVVMQHCPFGEVGDHYPRVVCAVHLGLMQGALDELGAHVEAGLEPFARPGLCAAHLARTPG